ncbi:unnamed protein product [Urochloa humidicola]
MAPPPHGPPYSSESSPSYSPSPLPMSPNSRLFSGAASLVLPPTPTPLPTTPRFPSSPGLWWPLRSLPSPVSTLDASLTPSPVYSPTTPPPSSWAPYSPVTPPIYYPTSSPTTYDAAGLISPGFHPCCSLPSCNCPLPTAYYYPSPDYYPEEFSHGAHAPPAPVPPLPYYNPTSQIHGNDYDYSSMAYSATAPGYCTAGSSAWNRTSPAWWDWEPPVLQLPPTPITSPWSDNYSPVTPRYSPVEYYRDDRQGASLGHGAATAPPVVYFCYCCLMPLEDCCCNGDASLTHGGGTSAPEYCYCCSTAVQDCSCMAAAAAPALPPLPPPA